MKSSDTAGESPESRQPGTERVEVAALAARIAELPHDGSALVERRSIDRHAESAVVKRSRSHGWFWWLCYLLAWAIVLALAAAAALRVLYHDGTYFLTWINAFTRYVYLPAYPCLMWAVWQRRWALALAGSAIVVCHLVWMAPDFLRDRRFDVPSGTSAIADSPSIRVFFANVLLTNRNRDEMLREIEAANPDVIVLSEWGWRWHQAFRKSPLAATYVHGISLKQPQHGGGVNIFSRLPIKRELQNVIAGRLVRTADIQIGSETLRLVALHAPRPMDVDGYDYFGFWNLTVPLLTTERGPLLIVGDFNATEHSRVYRQLKSAGLRSGHDDRGRGYATTWPNDRYWFPPIRIDQAFLSPEVECERIVEGRGRGSDHRPLVIDVRIREGVQRPGQVTAVEP